MDKVTCSERLKRAGPVFAGFGEGDQSGLYIESGEPGCLRGSNGLTHATVHDSPMRITTSCR